MQLSDFIPRHSSRGFFPKSIVLDLIRASCVIFNDGSWKITSSWVKNSCRWTQYNFHILSKVSLPFFSLEMRISHIPSRASLLKRGPMGATEPCPSAGVTSSATLVLNSSLVRVTLIVAIIWVTDKISNYVKQAFIEIKNLTFLQSHINPNE